MLKVKYKGHNTNHVLDLRSGCLWPMSVPWPCAHGSIWWSVCDRFKYYIDGSKQANNKWMLKRKHAEKRYSQQTIHFLRFYVTMNRGKKTSKLWQYSTAAITIPPFFSTKIQVHKISTCISALPVQTCLRNDQTYSTSFEKQVFCTCTDICDECNKCQQKWGSMVCNTFILTRPGINNFV